MLAYPRSLASYAVSVRQYRILPFGFLHCCRCQQPACHLLILLSVTSVYKGLTPSGKIHSSISSFGPENLYFRNFSRAYNECALLMQGAHSGLAKVAVQCSADTYVVNKSFALRINICGRNRHLRQARKRCKPF